MDKIRAHFPEHFGSRGRSALEKAGRKGGVSAITAVDPRPYAYSTQLWLLPSQAGPGLSHAQSFSCYSIKTHSGVVVAGTPFYSQQRGGLKGVRWVMGGHDTVDTDSSFQPMAISLAVPLSFACCPEVRYDSCKAAVFHD